MDLHSEVRCIRAYTLRELERKKSRVLATQFSVPLNCKTTVIETIRRSYWQAIMIKSVKDGRRKGVKGTC